MNEDNPTHYMEEDLERIEAELKALLNGQIDKVETAKDFLEFLDWFRGFLGNSEYYDSQETGQRLMIAWLEVLEEASRHGVDGPDLPEEPSWQYIAASLVQATLYV